MILIIIYVDFFSMSDMVRQHVCVYVSVCVCIFA